MISVLILGFDIPIAVSPDERGVNSIVSWSMVSWSMFSWRRVGPGAGRGGVAGPERALDHDAVDPVTELEPDGWQQADPAEAAGFVQPQRRLVGGVDIADHLAIAGGGAGIDERGQQDAADPGMDVIVMDIDRVLDRMAIGRSLAERHRVSVTGDGAVEIGDEVRQAAPAPALAPPLQLLRRHRFGLVGAEIPDPVGHLVAGDG